jgi:hypothetical protein
MKFLSYISGLLLLQLVFVIGVRGQEDLKAPPMYLVTIDPETGNDCITWYASPSPEIDFYIIANRVVTMPGEPDSYLPIGMVLVPDTIWCNTNTESASHPVGYAVWGVEDRGGQQVTGPFDRTDSTMFLQSVLDSCNGIITLNWNDYNSWRGSTLNYNIYRRLGPGIYELISSVDTNSFILNNVDLNQTYELFVEAVNIDGIRRSTSNRVIVYTDLSQQPDFINANYATINAGNTIDLSFTVGGSTDFTRFNLLRSSSENGPFELLAGITTQDSVITYTDDVPFTSGIYYYRLEVLNNCSIVSGQSNLACNIILNGTQSGSNISLGWNDYINWSGGVENYRVIRTIGRNNQQTDTLSAGTMTSFSDDVNGLVDYVNPSSSFICYQIDALEQLNVHGIRGRSISNRVCFSVMPDIRMPNAFIPNDTEPLNQVFEPVFSFLPEHYELIIYNRLGTKIWEGAGAWDGKVAGKYVPEGVYIYLLRVYNYSTDILELNGKVTIVFR